MSAPRHVGSGVAVRAWLAVGGLAVASGCLAIGSAGRRPGVPLRVVAYNIRHAAGMDGVVDLERIAAVLRLLDPDLVALQEVDERCRRSHGIDQAATLARLLGMEHRFAAFMPHDGGRYGLAVLSRLPIVASRRHDLPWRDEPRCALEVEVEVPGIDRPLRFLCVHNDPTAEAVRVGQVQAVLDGLGAAESPAIIAGDFNGEPDDESLQCLAAAGWRRLVKQGAAHDRRTFRADAPTKEIDHVVVRGLPPFTVEHHVAREPEASDHRPILAVFALASEPGRPWNTSAGAGCDDCRP